MYSQSPSCCCTPGPGRSSQPTPQGPVSAVPPPRVPRHKWRSTRPMKTKRSTLVPGKCQKKSLGQWATKDGSILHMWTLCIYSYVLFLISEQPNLRLNLRGPGFWPASFLLSFGSKGLVCFSLLSGCRLIHTYYTTSFPFESWAILVIGAISVRHCCFWDLSVRIAHIGNSNQNGGVAASNSSTSKLAGPGLVKAQGGGRAGTYEYIQHIVHLDIDL